MSCIRYRYFCELLYEYESNDALQNVPCITASLLRNEAFNAVRLLAGRGGGGNVDNAFCACPLKAPYDDVFAPATCLALAFGLQVLLLLLKMQLISD